MISSCLNAVAQQDDDTIEYVQGLPETGEESDVPPVSPDEVNTQSKVSVPRSKIPAAVLDALKDTALFDGWEKQEVFYDRKIKLYRVEVRGGETARFYMLDEDGKIVSVQEKTISDPK